MGGREEEVRLGAVVPAAGASRRMGREKVLLPFGASTILETVLGKLHEAGVRRTVVVLRQDLPEAAAAAERAGAEVVINPAPEEEMLVSILLGVERLGTSVDALFVWPADNPAVEAATLRRLAADAGRGVALIPVHEGRRGHPALVGADLAAQIQHIPPDSGLRRLWRERADAVREIAVDDPGILENLDDPAAYDRARRREKGSALS